MVNRNIVAIGTSAGGVEALSFLASRLPSGFPAAVLATIHLPSRPRSQLDDILTRAGPLPASFARHGERLETGRIYLAPAEHHLLLDGDRLALGSGPRENSARPAIDPMLRSVAVCCAARSIGVVLTGALGDGASGLWALKHCGGVAVVQDPGDALFPGMPESALSQVQPDHVARLADLPARLKDLVRGHAGQELPVPERIRLEVEIARNGRATMTEMDHIGERSVLACPDCGGVMWQISENGLRRYRCHVGHAYTAELMSVALDESLRRALASALRALEERTALVHGLRREAVQRGSNRMAANWEQRIGEYEREAEVIRSSIRRIDEIAEEGRKGEAAE